MVYSIRFINLLECYALAWKSDFVDAYTNIGEEGKFETLFYKYNKILESYQLFRRFSQIWAVRYSITDAEKKTCKNIQRFHDMNFRNLEIFGLFSIDAKSPLALFGLLANYTLVILQFMLIPSERLGITSWISELEYHCSFESDIEDQVTNHFKKLYQAYLDLMDAFNIFKRLFQFSFLLYNYNKHPPFFVTVQAKRLCKNVQRFNRTSFRKMTACNIFTVDASMAQMFNRLEVEYIIIILQFAFL
ncbi:hypothetical protein HF086_006410 [Spodoptera exigua]|uniref:Uncharacterized protein n=1 Tax=Spodoptera exigua TaxID=7107 RepID=A0A922MX46_SPOEX|nr:hypothetical protein HF086_006410 [Spodoptera exigua]